MHRALLLLVVVAFIPRAAAAQGEPLGPEFRVNTYTQLFQEFSAVASDASGNFVVVWQGSPFGVAGQRYASTGEPLGSEFGVSTYTPLSQSYPAVASDASGNFVVVWKSNAQDGSDWGIFGQRYASTGVPLGLEFRVNTYTPDDQKNPSVASDASGNFVVVWTSKTQHGSPWGIFGQRYVSTGAPLGPEFRVNTLDSDSSGNFVGPSVASDSSGNFVVVWQSNHQDGDSYGIFGQRYASSGEPLGSEFRVRVSTYTSGQSYPAVASDSSGNFVVVWQSYQDGGGDLGGPWGIFGQRYASAGAPLGPEFRVNTYTTNRQYWPAVASDSSGNFVVVWQSKTQDGSYNPGVFGQRYASTGEPLGPEFRVNTYTTYYQIHAAVAADASGNFVVVWSSYQDGQSYGVFGQRYGEIAPGPSWWGPSWRRPTDPVEP